MFEFVKNLPLEIKSLLWLFSVSFLGALVGFLTKTAPTLKAFPLGRKIRVFITGVLSSMFLAYISYELLKAGIDNNNLCVALAGFSAYLGTDLLVIIQERVIEKIKNKIDNL